MTVDETNKPIRRTTLADQVTEQLRDDILDGNVKPGERILPGDLEQRFGVSHIPIREAFRRLEVEGLLRTSPQRATIVTGLPLEDLHDLYELRRMIEPELAARAVLLMTDDDVTEIQRLFDELAAAEGLPEPGDPNLWNIHRDFHWAILAPAVTPWARRVLEQLWLGADRYIRLHATFGEPDESMRQHRELTESCTQRNPEELRQRLSEHLMYSEDLLCKKYLALREELPLEDEG